MFHKTTMYFFRKEKSNSKRSWNLQKALANNREFKRLYIIEKAR